MKLVSAIFHYFWKTNVFLCYLERSTFKRNLTYSCFFFPIISWTFTLTWATTGSLPSLNFLIWKMNCMSNWDNAHDVDIFPDEKITKRSETNKPSTNQEKHHERSSNFCYTLNPWENILLNIKSNEIFFKKHLLVETFSSDN